MPRDSAQPQSSPAGRGFGYLYDQIIAAKDAAVELESLWNDDAPVASMAGLASGIEDRFVELRSKLYNLAEAIDA